MTNDTWNPRDVPTYAVTDAGRLVGLRPDRVRRWLLGYSYKYRPAGAGNEREVSRSPVLLRVGARSSPFASFLDLVDLLFVKSFLEHGVSLQKLRIALDEASTLLGTPHFAQQKFFTDGHAIFLKVNSGGPALLQLMTGGQWVIAPVITAMAKRIEFHQLTGLAERWYPLGAGTPVVLDPKVCFGAPTILGRGTETAVVHDLFVAERRNLKSVCSWMDLRPEEVKAAVVFEEQLAAA